MWITTDQAAEMYARFCRARYGVNAKEIVEAKAAELRSSGDTEGERVWAKVKRQIEIQVAR
jgi:hypothetical protein